MVVENCFFSQKDLGGIYSAREFVWWYNGHPDCHDMEPDLKSTDTAVVLGQGNVALDAAHILLRPMVELSTTDISSHALSSIQESTIRKVYLVGRRGPAQAACTAKELREILNIKDMNVYIREGDLVTSPADEETRKFFPSNNGCHVNGVRLEKTCLRENGSFGRLVAVGTGEFEDLHCRRSSYYKGQDC